VGVVARTRNLSLSSVEKATEAKTPRTPPSSVSRACGFAKFDFRL